VQIFGLNAGKPTTSEGTIMEALLLRKIPANGIDSSVAVTIAFLILSSCYLVYQVATFTHRPYPSIPLIGKDASTTTTSAAKARWVTSARQLISSGLRIGKPFQVLATVRPMIILPAKYIDEIKNHANFNFSKAVESNFYGKYPGFDGLNSLNQNEVFQDAIRVRLTKNLSMLNQILCSHILQELTYPCVDRLAIPLAQEAEITVRETFPQSQGVFLKKVLSSVTSNLTVEQKSGRTAHSATMQPQ
jgi:hypothetical protein